MVTSYPSRQVASLVTDEIERMGLSRLQLSEKTGIAYTTLNRKLNGQSEFDFAELFSVAEALGVKPSAFTPKEFRPDDSAA